MAGHGFLDSLRHTGGVVRCMRYVHGPATEAGLVDETDKQDMEEALNPPMVIVAGAAAAYAGTNVALRYGMPRLLRTRPLVLQLAACVPAGLILFAGGLSRCHSLLRVLARDRGSSAESGSSGPSPLGRELRARCGPALHHDSE
mmetsp:Transcript_726/g.1011  ORF Transcript_726/g.1011 Transcript_726/m.1011 type:complete len:144 (-) Transcript_726:61-492(-)